MHTVQKHLAGFTILQVFTRVDLVTDIEPGLIKRVKNREPTPGQVVKRLLDQSRWPEWLGVGLRPGQRAREGGMRGDPQIGAGSGGRQHLLHCPLLPPQQVAANLGRGETIETRVLGGVQRHQLALQVGGQLGELQAVLRQGCP